MNMKYEINSLSLLNKIRNIKLKLYSETIKIISAIEFV